MTLSPPLRKLVFGPALSLSASMICASADTLELGLLMDASGSVTAEDFSARNASLAGALGNRWVLSAIESGSRELALGVYQYSGPGQVGESLPWQTIGDGASARSAAADLLAMSRLFAGGADLDSALAITSISTAGNGITGDSTSLLILGDGPTTATGIGRDIALGQGIDSIAAWVTGEAGDLDGYLANAASGDGLGNLLLEDPKEIQQALAAFLFRYFHNPDDTAAAASAGFGQAILDGSRFAFVDVNARLMRLRSGAGDADPAAFIAKWPVGSKGEPVAVPGEPMVRWSIHGSISGGLANGGDRYTSVFGIPVLLQAGHELEYEAATAGVEAHFRGNWTLGAAFIAHHGDIDLGATGEGEDDALGGAIYLSHQRPLGWQGYTVYGDLMAGWLSHDVELDRWLSTGIARGEADADTQIVELNLGARRTDFAIMHGPELGVSMTRGGIDSFQEGGAATAVHPETDFASTVLRLGYQGSLRVELGKVPLTFSAGTGWEHEFEDTDLAVGGPEIGSIAEDSWIVNLAARAAITESVGLHATFENRLASRADSQFLKLGCDVSF
jgi:hypothetical protein